MLRYLPALCLLFAAWTSVKASDFNIEDESLRPLPAAALTVLRAHIATTEYKECATGEFVGTNVDLAGRGRKVDWIAKTADGCAWGASTAKIWILERQANAYRLVLYTGGQVVDLHKEKSRKLRNLTVASGNAGHYAETLFKFNGTEYVGFPTRR